MTGNGGRASHGAQRARPSPWPISAYVLCALQRGLYLPRSSGGRPVACSPSACPWRPPKSRQDQSDSEAVRGCQSQQRASSKPEGLEAGPPAGLPDPIDSVLTDCALARCAEQTLIICSLHRVILRGGGLARGQAGRDETWQSQAAGSCAVVSSRPPLSAASWPMFLRRCTGTQRRANHFSATPRH